MLRFAELGSWRFAPLPHCWRCRFRVTPWFWPNEAKSSSHRATGVDVHVQYGRPDTYSAGPGGLEPLQFVQRLVEASLQGGFVAGQLGELVDPAPCEGDGRGVGVGVARRSFDL